MVQPTKTENFCLIIESLLCLDLLFIVTMYTIAKMWERKERMNEAPTEDE